MLLSPPRRAVKPIDYTQQSASEDTLHDEGTSPRLPYSALPLKDRFGPLLVAGSAVVLVRAGFVEDPVIYTESSKSSGCFSAMASNFKAASLGVRRPASHA
jgi:hypothetical protein